MEDQVEIGEGIVIKWQAVKSLKMLGEKLLFEMHDHSLLELSGLSHKQIDAIFAAYSKHLHRAKK